MPNLADRSGTLLDGELAVGDGGAVAGGIAGVQHVGQVLAQVSATRACNTLQCSARRTGSGSGIRHTCLQHVHRNTLQGSPRRTGSVLAQVPSTCACNTCTGTRYNVQNVGQVLAQVPSTRACNTCTGIRYRVTT